MTDILFRIWLTATWQAIVLAGVVFIVLSLFRERLQPRWRYLLWCVVLLRLAMPVLPETPWGIWNENASHVAPVPVPPMEVEPMPVIPPPVLPQPVEITEVFEPTESPVAVFAQEPVVSTAEEPKQIGFPSVYSIKTGFLVIWLAGFLFLLLKYLWNEYRFHRQSRYWKPAENVRLLALFEQCRKETGIRQQILLKTAPDDVGAGCFGFFRPVIVLAESAMKMNENDLRMILLHELVHLKRLDPLVLRISMLLSLIHWPNPLVWFVLSRLQREREPACDAAVLHILGQNKQKDYGLAILAFAELFPYRERLPGLVGIFEKNGTTRRIEMIIKYKRSKWPHTLLGLLIITLIAALGLTRAGEKPKTDEKLEVNVSVNETPKVFTVLDGSKNPVAGVSVTVMWGEDDGIATAVTDEDGKYALDMPERFRSRWGTAFVVDKDRKRVGNGEFLIDPMTKSVMIDPITLVPARTITGTVVDNDGKPAPNVLVAGGHQTTHSEIVRTNEKGEFKFLYPEEPSLQYVYAYLENTALDFVPTEEYPSYYGKTPKELIKDGPFHLKLRPVEPFQIRVVDEAGKPIVGSRVMPWIIENPDKPKTLRSLNDQRNRLNTSGMPVFDVKTDAEGLALVRSVPGDFLQHSTFSAYGPHEMTMPDGTKRSYGSISKTWKELTEDGKTPTIVLPRLAVTRGTIKLEDGTPVAKAHLSLRYHEGSCGWRDTDENGKFTLMDNPNTIYNISISSDQGAAPAIFNYNMGNGTEEKRLDIVLKKGIRVFGKVYDPDGLPSKLLDMTVNEYDPNPPEAFHKTSPEKRERSRFVYGTDTADRSVYSQDATEGEYEFFLSTEPRKYRIHADGYPSSADMRDSHDLEIKGDEKEIRLDFHLKKPGGVIQGAIKNISEWFTGVTNSENSTQNKSIRMAADDVTVFENGIRKNEKTGKVISDESSPKPEFF